MPGTAEKGYWRSFKTYQCVLHHLPIAISDLVHEYFFYNLERNHFLWIDEFEIGYHGNVERFIPMKIWTYNRSLHRFLRGVCAGRHLEFLKILCPLKAEELDFSFEDACYHGDPKIIQFLYEQGATNFNRGLYRACDEANVELILWLIEKGADDFQGGLARAIEFKHVEVQVIMLEQLQKKTF
jgi:hypothetical protein